MTSLVPILRSLVISGLVNSRNSYFKETVKVSTKPRSSTTSAATFNKTSRMRSISWKPRWSYSNKLSRSSSVNCKMLPLEPMWATKMLSTNWKHSKAKCSNIHLSNSRSCRAHCSTRAGAHELPFTKKERSSQWSNQMRSSMPLRTEWARPSWSRLDKTRLTMIRFRRCAIRNLISYDTLD